MSTMEQNNIENQVCDAISILVDEGVNSAGYDKTISALVVECVDSLKGQYKVKYQDAYYYATSDNTEVEYSKNTQVYILVPGNDFSREKKIVGTVKDLGDAYISSWDESNQYVVVGRNCAELLNPQELCSYKSGKYKLEELILYKDGESNNKLKLEKDELAKYLVDSEKLRIGATFKTALADEQRQRGNYGISVKAEFNDADNTEQIISQTFNLTADDMVGMPYDFGVPTAQYLDFDINGKNFIKITQVALLIADFPVSEKEGEDYPNDIFISDFIIEGIAPPDAKVFTTYYLDIKSSIGKYLTETDTKTTLEAVLSLKNKTVTSSSLEYYWFIEDASVVTTSDLYCVHGGQGWRCLNDQKTITEEVTKPNGEVEKQERKEWIPGTATREVSRENIPNIKSIYKCVCIYNSGKSSIAAEIELENTSPTYKFEMSSVNGTEFILDRGKTTLKFLDTTKAEKDQDNSLVYHWAKTDASGGYHYLGGDNSGNGGELPVCDKFDNSSLMKYLRQLSLNYTKYLGNKLVKTKSVYSEYSTFNKEDSVEEEKSILREGFKDFGLSDVDTAKVISDIILVLKLDGPTNEELANAIQPYLDSVSITWIDEFTFYDVPARSILSYNIFKCTAMKTNGEVLGTARIQLNNKHVANDNGYIIVENGNQTFKYSAEGVAPTDKNNKNPLTIKPLTFKLFDETGNEVSGIKDEDISWYYPLENTLIKVEGSESDLKTTDEKWGIRHGQTFVFDIESRFKYEASNDVIKIEVKHQDRVLKQDTSFSFIKDGMSGTNGTDYFCRIVPKYDLDNAYPTLVYNKALGNESPLFLNKPEYTLEDNGDWFTVELWNGSELVTSSDLSATFKILFPAASIPTEGYFSLIEIQNNKFSFNRNNISKLTTLDTIKNNSYGKEEEEKRNQYENGLLNIIRAEVEYQGKKYFAELPLAVAIIEVNEGKDVDYGIYVKTGTGYNEVVYAADGARPTYASAYPFEAQVIRYENGEELDLSTTLANETYKTPFIYNWDYTLGRFRQINYNLKNNEFLTVTKLQEAAKDAEGNEIKNENGTVQMVDIEGPARKVVPSPYYNGGSTDLGVKCIVRKSDNTLLGTLYFPIHFMLNKFGYSALNDWDGTSVEINEDEGYILSPQIGAGKKDPNNRFTGVLMGEMKSGHEANSDIGLLGFHEGVRTIFLDAETGKAEFGKTGAGQIILDPTSDKAQIYSGNYYRKTEAGAVDFENLQGKGMLIDFTTPEIKFGSGKFEVNSEGEIKSTAGYIGGWNIELDRLWGQYTKTEDNKTTTYYNSLNLWNENEEGTKWASAICIGSTNQKSTKPSDANFTVSQTGILNAKGASIDGDIVAKSLQLTSGDNSNVYTKNEVNGEIQKLNPADIAYTNQIVLDSEVDENGRTLTTITVKDKNGNVKHTYNTVTDKNSFIFDHAFGTEQTIPGIGNNPATQSKKGYVKLSKEGLLTAHNAFIYGDIYATNGYFAGELKATKGEIGGWYIGSHRLYASYGGKYTRLQDGSLEYSIVVGGSSSTSSGDSAPFGVKHDGSFHATKATISGVLTAGSGSKIGPWTVSSSAIYKGDSSYPTSTSGNIYIGEDGISLGANFKVSKTGEMTASSGSFSGSLDGASGTFTGSLTASTTKFTKLSAGDGNMIVSSSQINIGDGAMKVDKNKICINPGDNKAKIWIGDPKDGGWEDISIFPYSYLDKNGKPVSCGKTNDSAKGNVGTQDYPFHVGSFINMHYSSERYLKNNIQMYNTNQAYDELKTLPIFTFNYRQKNEKETADLKLGTMIDYIPAEVMAQDRAYENRAYEIGNLLFWDIAATQVIQQKLEETIQEKEILQNRLDVLEQKFLEMEEKLNGFN